MKIEKHFLQENRTKTNPPRCLDETPPPFLVKSLFVSFVCFVVNRSPAVPDRNLCNLRNLWITKAVPGSASHLRIFVSICGSVFG